MIICSPAKSALRQYSKEEKVKIIKNFLISVNKKKYEDLNAGEKERLGVELRGHFVKHNFDYTPVLMSLTQTNGS